MVGCITGKLLGEVQAKEDGKGPLNRINQCWASAGDADRQLVENGLWNKSVSQT